ncbi:hypothetical protein NUW54_g2428 [Trametes sanguinea]|uniref:Uncharacterized protein n=1 Tax=Trametes sanguinea TaxID=158606 RepID=A0ACC1Q681_9APHY|nr:hypothetical protein NUW54_g2428 [Trametes sanguinea]
MNAPNLLKRVYCAQLQLVNDSRLAQLVERVTSTASTGNDEVGRSSRPTGIALPFSRALHGIAFDVEANPELQTIIRKQGNTLGKVNTKSVPLGVVQKHERYAPTITHCHGCWLHMYSVSRIAELHLDDIAQRPEVSYRTNSDITTTTHFPTREMTDTTIAKSFSRRGPIDQIYVARQHVPV